MSVDVADARAVLEQKLEARAEQLVATDDVCRLLRRAIAALDGDDAVAPVPDPAATRASTTASRGANVDAAREETALALLETGPKSIAALTEHMGVSQPTARKVLTGLARTRRVHRSGAGNNTRWNLGPPAGQTAGSSKEAVPRA